VHHRTIQINHQPDATIFQFIILTFIYSSTCFRRSPAHHQELNDCSSSLWYYLRIVVIAVLCSWSGRLFIYPYVDIVRPQFLVSACLVNPLKPELNPICYLLALLGAHHFLHVSRIRVKLLTFRRLMSYIYGAPILDVSRSHTTTQHSR